MKIRSRVGLLARLIAVLLAFTLVAAACGDDSGDGEAEVDDEGTTDDEATTDDETTGDVEGSADQTTCEGAACDEPVDDSAPVVGGTLRVGVEAETDGLNPTANNFAVSAYIMGYPVMDPLFYFDEEGNWFPWLAESATPVGDGSSWQIKVREGVLFHDGSELTADDLIANFEAAITDPIISLAIVPSYPPENRTEKIDEYTVQYNLIRPSQHFPVNLTSQLGMVTSGDWLAAAAEDDSLNQFPIGTGPFMVESREQDASTKLVKFEDYWQGTDDIYLDAIEVFPITDTAIAAERLSVGELDVVVTSNPDAQIVLEDASGVSLFSNLLSGEDFAMMNTNVAPTDDIRVRQALTFAADRESYLSLIAQGTKPAADSMYHPDLIWNNPDVVQEGNMPELAGPLVDSYCAEFADNCTDGKVDIELQFSGPSVTQTRIMDILSAGWEPYFNVSRQELLQDDHITEVATGQWQVVTWRQFGAIDPDNEVVWLECATATGLIALNWPRVCDETRDALLFEQRATTDQARRVEIMQQIQADINATYSYIFFTHTNWVVGFRDSVKNLCGQSGPGDVTLICNNQGRSFFHNVWIDEG